MILSYTLVSTELALETLAKYPLAASLFSRRKNARNTYYKTHRYAFEGCRQYQPTYIPTYTRSTEKRKEKKEPPPPRTPSLFLLALLASAEFIPSAQSNYKS